MRPWRTATITLMAQTQQWHKPSDWLIPWDEILRFRHHVDGHVQVVATAA